MELVARTEPHLQSEIEALCETARWCAARGWVPATSGNFSVRPAKAEGRIYITASGFDKGQLTCDLLLELGMDGDVLRGTGRPSAESCLHTALYQKRPEAGAILHVHTVWNTLLSGHFLEKGAVPLEGYELLKALDGVATHAHLEQIPVLANSQDYKALTEAFEAALDAYPHAHGVLLGRHGLYTWGNSVADARRHLEALEFLFEVEGRRLTGNLA